MNYQTSQPKPSFRGTVIVTGSFFKSSDWLPAGNDSVSLGNDYGNERSSSWVSLLDANVWHGRLAKETASSHSITAVEGGSFQQR